MYDPEDEDLSKEDLDSRIEDIERRLAYIEGIVVVQNRAYPVVEGE